jgi:hypothetical protein
MKILMPFALILAVSSVAVPPARALPDNEAVPGRLILRHFADAVVTIKATVILNITVDNRPVPPQDNKIDVTGTVITPTGMVVTSLSLIDPRAIFESLRARAPGGADVKLGQTDYKDLKLQFGDGTELPVKVIWKDADRDVALLAPVAALAGGRTVTYVNLNEAPASAIVLGAYFELSRMGETLQRAPVVRPSTVIGIIERPRRMLLVSTDSVGCPVFDVQGHALGICLRLMVNNAWAGMVVVPSSDIVEIVTQMSQL